jgi:peptide/nickel transport system substrate-binding protein
MTRFRFPVVALLAIVTATVPAAARDAIEPPFLMGRVTAGELPPVAARLPENPSVVHFAGERKAGRHGGDMRLLLARSKDVRMMVVYGYARLVAWTPDFHLVPDIAEAVEVQDGRRFTFRLRTGHRWSDGQPFTSEDFRYWWDDIANNRRLSPAGPPSEMLVQGRPPRFEAVDERTVRFTWDEPNPDFLPALAGAAPLYIYRPAHYLKRFHEKYAEPKRLAERVKRAGQRNWAALHNRRDNQYRNDNPSLPTLQPWVAQTRPPTQRFVFARNPYYHRIDANGRQLPYIDRVIVNIADAKIVPAKTAAGESDLQARGLHFSDYTFLKRGEKSHDRYIRLWRTVKGAHIALYPNLNANDPLWRALFRDVRVRRALSLAIDRHEINQVIYFGLAQEGANTVLVGSPLYRAEYQKAWARFDPRHANALLDAAGLTKRDDRGIRLLSDGRPAELVVETAGEDTEQADVLELIRDGWRRIGFKLHIRPSQRELFRNRIFAGETLVSVWSGYENGLPTPRMSPAEFAPTSQQQLQWPKWGQHFQTSGAVGKAPADPAARELLRLYRSWRVAATAPQRERIWHRMLEINAEEVFSIGVISGVPQPVAVSSDLRNVPAAGIYNWDPGAFFGMYRPDTFWFEKPRTADAAPAPAKKKKKKNKRKGGGG